MRKKRTFDPRTDGRDGAHVHVEAMEPPDFDEDSPLRRLLVLGVEAIRQRIELRRLGHETGQSREA